MPFLCVPGWDIYVFSHETSETVENIWLTNYFWSGPKNPVFLTISGLWGPFRRPYRPPRGASSKWNLYIYVGDLLQAILSRKNWTGLAGALRNGQNQSKYDFCSVGWPLLVKTPFFPFLVQIGPNHSGMVPNGPKVVSDSFLPFGTISEWFGPIRIKNRKNGFFAQNSQPTEQTLWNQIFLIVSLDSWLKT